MLRVTHFYSLAIIVSCTMPATADIAPPPPKSGFKRVPFEHVVKLEKEIPAYRFFTFQQLGIDGEFTITKELELTKEKGVTVPSNSSASVRTGVVAVPDKVMDELESKENLAKLLASEEEKKLPAGVVVHDTSGTIRDLKKSDARSKVVNEITVSPDKKAGVKFNAKETPPPPGEEATREALLPPFAMLIAGAAAALAIAGIGMIYFRRGSAGEAPT